MSNSSSPYTGSTYVSPVPTPPLPVSKTGSSRSTPKPTNVFTNDGSFLERIQRSKREEEEKRKEQEMLERKKNFDSRFRNRGKRPPPDPTPASDAPTRTAQDPPAKKAKTEESVTEYGKQLRTLGGSSGMKDTGNDIHSLVK